MTRAHVFVAVALAVVSCGQPPPDDPTHPKANDRRTLVDRGCPSSPPSSKSDAQALERLASKRITKSCLYGVGASDPVRAEGAIRSRPGQLLSPAQVHEDVRTLMALGRFEDIEVSAKQNGDELVVFFLFQEQPPIAEVTFEGAALLQKEGLEPKIVAEGNKPIVIANVYDALTLIRDEYHRRGYRNVAIDVVTDRSNSSRTRLKIVITEGRPFKVGKIAVNGAGKTRKEDVRKAARLEPGTPLDEDQVLKAVRGIEEYYLDHGYPNARVAPSIGSSGADGSTPVGFDVIEGDLVHFGAVTTVSVEGASLKAPSVELRSSQGAAYSRSAVEDDVRALIAGFAARGQKVVVVPRRELDPKKHTIDVIFQMAPAPN